MSSQSNSPKSTGTTKILPHRYHILAGFLAPTVIYGLLLFLRSLPDDVIVAASAAQIGVTLVALMIRPRMGFGMALALLIWSPVWLTLQLGLLATHV